MDRIKEFVSNLFKKKKEKNTPVRYLVGTLDEEQSFQKKNKDPGKMKTKHNDEMRFVNVCSNDVV